MSCLFRACYLPTRNACLCITWSIWLAFGHGFWPKNGQWPPSANDIDRIPLKETIVLSPSHTGGKEKTSSWSKFLHLQNSNMFEKLICHLPGKRTFPQHQGSDSWLLTFSLWLIADLPISWVETQKCRCPSYLIDLKKRTSQKFIWGVPKMVVPNNHGFSY